MLCCDSAAVDYQFQKTPPLLIKPFLGVCNILVKPISNIQFMWKSVRLYLSFPGDSFLSLAIVVNAHFI